MQELNRILFSALETSLVGTSGHDLINRLYHGIVVNQIVCKECKNISERQVKVADYPAEVSVWYVEDLSVLCCFIKRIITSFLGITGGLFEFRQCILVRVLHTCNHVSYLRLCH